MYPSHSVLLPCEVGLCFCLFCTSGNGGPKRSSNLPKVAQQGSEVGMGTQAAWHLTLLSNYSPWTCFPSRRLSSKLLGQISPQIMELMTVESSGNSWSCSYFLSYHWAQSQCLPLNPRPFLWTSSPSPHSQFSQLLLPTPHLCSPEFSNCLPVLFHSQEGSFSLVISSHASFTK